MKNVILLVILMGFFTGCGPKSSSKDRAASSEDMEIGFELLDQQRFDEAEEYFRKLYEAKPGDDTLKALASVYIAKANVRIASLYEVSLTLPTEKITADNLGDQLKAYRNSLEKIPNVRGRERAYMTYAARLLNERETRSVRFLRSFVNLVLLRSTISDADQLLKAPLKIQSEKDLKALCKSDWTGIRSWISNWTYYGMELKKDLDLVYPKEQKQWAQGEKFFLEARKSSNLLRQACGP